MEEGVLGGYRLIFIFSSIHPSLHNTTHRDRIHKVGNEGKGGGIQISFYF